MLGKEMGEEENFGDVSNMVEIAVGAKELLI